MINALLPLFFVATLLLLCAQLPTLPLQPSVGVGCSATRAERPSPLERRAL